MVGAKITPPRRFETGFREPDGVTIIRALVGEDFVVRLRHVRRILIYRELDGAPP